MLSLSPCSIHGTSSLVCSVLQRVLSFSLKKTQNLLLSQFFKKNKNASIRLTWVEENWQYTQLCSLYSRRPKTTFRVNLAQIRAV